MEESKTLTKTEFDNFIKECEAKGVNTTSLQKFQSDNNSDHITIIKKSDGTWKLKGDGAVALVLSGAITTLLGVIVMGLLGGGKGGNKDSSFDRFF